MSELGAVLPRLAAVLGEPCSEPVSLDGGITNRNFRVMLGGHDAVVRLCASRTEALGIDRETEFEATRRAAALGIGPPLLARLARDGVLVTGFLEGRALSAGGLCEPAMLRSVAEALRAFHAGTPLATEFNVFELVQDQARLVAVPPAEHAAFVALAHRIRAALAGHPDNGHVPCHNDLLRANLLDTPAGVRIVDWEYAGMNDRFFDLANLAANNGFDEDDDVALLEAYWQRPVTPRCIAALELMRFVSDLREAMWGVAQTALSSLADVDYAGYAEEHLGRCRLRARDPRVEGWLARAQAA